MRNRMIFILMLLFTLAAQAQDTGGQVKLIRKVYAEAKKRIAENGKNGAAPLNVDIICRDASEVSEDFTIESSCRRQVFFSEVPTDDGYFENVPYFISISTGSNGHSLYREFLYDPQKGHLLFSYMKGETHAGFTVETRYYYDANGHCIESKHNTDINDFDFYCDSQRAQARKMLRTFRAAFQ